MTDTPPVPIEATTGLPPTAAAAPAAPAAAPVAAAADGAETAAAAEAPAAPRVDLSPAACAAELAARFPALFGPGAPRPLKLRIQADIQARAPGVFTRKSLSLFLHRYTTSNAYLNALSRAPQRIDLDGAEAGEIADEHRSAAAEELARRRAVHENRMREQRAAENAARREAEAQQRQARAADDEARRERAALLRAFETSTLTRANFCALKRVAETELDAQLAQARQEREQRALEPRPNERHGGPPSGAGRRDGDGRGPGRGRGPR